MVDAKEFFAGNFLKAEDCKGGEICIITDEGEITELTSPEGKVKSVLNIPVNVNGKEKIFTPNKSNGDVLVNAYGADTKAWIGQAFKIELAKVRVFGKVKDGIVVIPTDKVETQKI